MLNLVRLDSGFVNAQTNAPQAPAFDTVGEGDDDRQPYGDAQLMPALGLSALPYEANATGHAEGIAAEGVGGQPAIVIAAWDPRTFSLFGNLEGGDTCLHSTGPNQAAQLILKETKKQAVLVTKDKNGNLMSLSLDGNAGKVQVQAFGNVFEITEDHILLEFGDCGIRLSKDGIHLRGAIQIGGMAPIPQTSMAVATSVDWAKVAALTGAVIVPVPNAIGAL